MEIYKPMHIDFGDLCRICLNYEADTPHCNIFESRISDPDLDAKDANLLLCEALQSITSITVSISYILVQIVIQSFKLKYLTERFCISLPIVHSKGRFATIDMF